MLHLRIALLSIAAIALVSASTLSADWTITTRESYNGRSSTQTIDYCRDGATRAERNAGDHSGISIIAQPNAHWIAIDPHSGEYTDCSAYRNQRTMNIARLTPSNITYVIDTDTKATGEKRVFFGIEAQRYVTTQRLRTIVEGVSPDQEIGITIDGWYAHIDGCAPRFGHSSAASVTYLGSGLGGPPKMIFTHSGPALPNLALSERTRNRVLEVTQLSKAPLDAKLFEPPANFRLVDQLHLQPRLSWMDHVFLAWDQFEGWLGNLL